MPIYGKMFEGSKSLWKWKKIWFLCLLPIWVLFMVSFLYQKSFESSFCASILGSPIKNVIFDPVQTGRLHKAHPWSNVSIIHSNWIKLSIWSSRLICHVSIADLCLCHCKCFCDIYCVCSVVVDYIWFCLGQSIKTIILTLTPAEGFLLASIHKTLKGKLYYLDNQAVAISAHVLGYTISCKNGLGYWFGLWTCWSIFIQPSISHCVCTMHKESQLILSS